MFTVCHWVRVRSVFFAILGLSLGICLSFSTASAWPAASFQSFIEVRENFSVYTEFSPAQAGSETVVLLNGLTYSTKEWRKYVAALQSRGIGVLAFDFEGQGQTLYKYGPAQALIDIESQVADLVVLLRNLGARGPQHFIGLSYGGGVLGAIAKLHPEMIRTAISMAPYTRPLQNQDLWIRSQILATKILNPFYPWDDEVLYDFYLRQNIYLTYPAAEPVTLEHPYKLEGCFRLVQGIRRFPSLSAARLFPAKSFHLMIGGEDQYVPRTDMDDYWLAVPEEARGSKIVIENSEHKIPEAVPEFAAAWTEQILRNHPHLKSGQAITGYPKEMRAVIDSTQEIIQLQ